MICCRAIISTNYTRVNIYVCILSMALFMVNSLVKYWLVLEYWLCLLHVCGLVHSSLNLSLFSLSLSLSLSLTSSRYFFNFLFPILLLLVSGYQMLTETKYNYVNYSLETPVI